MAWHGLAVFLLLFFSICICYQCWINMARTELTHTHFFELLAGTRIDGITSTDNEKIKFKSTHFGEQSSSLSLPLSHSFQVFIDFDLWKDSNYSAKWTRRIPRINFVSAKSHSHEFCPEKFFGCWFIVFTAHTRTTQYAIQSTHIYYFIYFIIVVAVAVDVVVVAINDQQSYILIIMIITTSTWHNNGPNHTKKVKEPMSVFGIVC